MGTASQIATSVTAFTSAAKGFQAISLSAIATSSAPTIMAGSVLEVAGAIFHWTTEETPAASSWTAIATATSAYLICTPSGSAGSQILTTTYTSSAPVWVDAKVAFYTSAGSNIRAIAHVYKTGTTAYDYKSILRPFNNEDIAGIGTQEVKVYGSTGWHIKGINPGIRLENTAAGGGTYDIFSGTDSGSRVFVIRDSVAERLRITTTGSVVLGYGLNTGGTSLITKVVQIGEWDMLSGSLTATVAHGIADITAITNVGITIRDDSGNNIYPIDYSTSAETVAGRWDIDTTNVNLEVWGTSFFRTSNFNATAGTVVSRGYVTLIYEV